MDVRNSSCLGPDGKRLKRTGNTFGVGEERGIKEHVQARKNDHRQDDTQTEHFSPTKLGDQPARSSLFAMSSALRLRSLSTTQTQIYLRHCERDDQHAG